MDSKGINLGFGFGHNRRIEFIIADLIQLLLIYVMQVQRYYSFHPLTAYLAVNYLDRFLYSRSLPAVCPELILSGLIPYNTSLVHV